MSDEKKVLLSVQIKAEQALTEIAKTRKAIEELRSIQKGLDRTTEEGRVQYEQYGASIRELSGKLREQTKQYDTHTKYVQAESESLEELKARLSLLTAEYNKMSKAQRNSDDGLVLKDNINQITNELKGAEQEVGNFRRSVGDYENSIKNALAGNNKFLQGIFGISDGAKEAGDSFGKQATSGVKAFGKSLLSLLANPIVFIVAGITAAVMALFSAFKSTDDGATMLSGVFKALGNVMEVLKNRVVSLIGVFKSLISLDFKGMKEHAVDAFGGIGTAIRDAAQAGYEYEQQMDRISDKESGNLVQNARMRREIEELKNASKDRTKSEEERLKASQRASDLSLKLLQREKEIAEERTRETLKDLSAVSEVKEEQINKWLELDGIEQEQLKETDAAYADFYNKNEDRIQNLQKMKAENIDMDANYYKETRRLESEQSTLLVTLQNERNAKAKEAATKRKEMAQRIAQAENDLYNIQATAQLKAYEETANNTKLSYAERLRALNDYRQQQELIITENANFEKKSKDLTNAEIKAIDEKAKQEKIDLENATNKQIEDLNKTHLEKTLNDYKTQIENKTFENEQAYEEDYLKLIKQLDKGNITTEEFEKQKRALVRKYEEQSFNDTLDLLEKQLDIEGVTGEQKLDIQRAIDAKRLQMKQQANDAELESTKERIQKEKALEVEFSNLKKELYAQLQQTIVEITGAMFASRIQEIESETEAVKENAENQKQAIDEKERAGVISKSTAENQKKAIDKKNREDEKKLEDEKKKAQREQAIAEKIFATFSIGLSTAQAIMKSLAQTPLPLGAPFVVMNAALGALQIASVLSQPLPKASMGMLLRGKSHAFGGIPIEAEDGEAIINKRSTSMFAPLLSLINEAGGGIPFVPHANRLMDGGYSIRTYSDKQINEKIIEAAIIKGMKETKIITTIEDIRKGDEMYSEIESGANF